MYLGGLIDASADIMPDIKSLKLRMLKADVMETLLYGCVPWTLGKEHFVELRTAYHRFLLRGPYSGRTMSD